MNIVTFPGFNLELNVPQIAFSFGNIEIYYYAICIVSGIIISLFLCSKAKENFEINFEDVLEIMIFSLVFGIIGARLYYVIFNLENYVSNPSKIFNLRDGGLAIYGGIIAGAISAYLICKKKKIDVLDFFDYICPYLALAQAIGRFGNFFNVEAFGEETTSLFRMGIYLGNEYREVHPCFLYEFVACILIFVALRIVQKKRIFKGQIFSVYLISYGLARFLIESIRSDSLMLYSFRISQIVSIIFIIYGMYLYINKISQLHNNICRKTSNNE